MVNRFISWILSLIGIAIFVVIVGGIVFGVLAATGGGLDGCTPDKPDATGIIVKRGVTRSSELSQEWQRIWDDFDARLAAGQSGSISFTEGQASSRADAFLKDKDAPVDNVVICFHEGEGEAGAKVDVPALSDIPVLGGLFDTNVRVRGTIDLSGDHPKIIITKLEAGNLPSFASDQIKGSIEDVVNTRLDDLKIKHKHSVTFHEEKVEISGTP